MFWCHNTLPAAAYWLYIYWEMKWLVKLLNTTTSTHENKSEVVKKKVRVGKIRTHNLLDQIGLRPLAIWPPYIKLTSLILPFWWMHQSRPELFLYIAKTYFQVTKLCSYHNNFCNPKIATKYFSTWNWQNFDKIFPFFVSKQVSHETKCFWECF